MPIVNGLEAARTALHAGASQLESSPYAACHAGVHYYAALVEQLRGEFPAQPFTFTLCCGDDPAIAHDALRMGLSLIRIQCSEGIWAQLHAIATQQGAVITRST